MFIPLTVQFCYRCYCHLLNYLAVTSEKARFLQVKNDNVKCCHSCKDHQRSKSSIFRSGKILPLMTKDNSEKKKCRWNWKLQITDKLRLVQHVHDQFWVVSYRSDDHVYSCTVIRETSTSFISVSQISTVEENHTVLERQRTGLHLTKEKLSGAFHMRSFIVFRYMDSGSAFRYVIYLICSVLFSSLLHVSDT